EGAGNDGPAHGVSVLNQCPGIGQYTPETGDLERSVGETLIGDGMLHPAIGGHDEEAGEPGSDKDEERGPPMSFGAEAFFSEQEESEERRFQEEREDTFHSHRLSDDAAGELRESRPVGAELEFHGNSGDYSCQEVDAENPGPEPGSVIVGRVAGAKRQGLENDYERCEAHGQLRKNVVIN